MVKTTTDTWAQPQEASVWDTSVSHLMPAYSEIPDDFKRATNAYVRTTSEWFFNGIKRAQLRAKAGIDSDKALRHLAVIQQSWDPPHEHKTAAVAYLMSRWFDLT